MAKKNIKQNTEINDINEEDLKKELYGVSPRGCAIVGGAIVEAMLEKLLIKYFIDDKKEVENYFSFSSGPMGNFSAKIKPHTY